MPRKVTTIEDRIKYLDEVQGMVLHDSHTDVLVRQGGWYGGGLARVM